MKYVGYFVSIIFWSMATMCLLYVFSPFKLGYRGNDDIGYYGMIQERQEGLTLGCLLRNRTQQLCRPSYEEIYVDEQRKYVYCLVSKAACTSWKRTLLALTGRIPNVTQPEQMRFGFVHSHRHTDLVLKRLAMYSPEDVEYILANYYKFMFVREPLERLLSAYRDKMLRDVGYIRKYSHKILDRYRMDYTGNLSIEPPVTFSEFVWYVIDAWSEREFLDRHWNPQHNLCCPCHIKYDFVGHHETLYRDADTVLAQLKARGPPSEVKFPRSDPDNAHNKSSALLEDYYAAISYSDAQKLFEMYAVDYELFGYQHPNLTRFARYD